MIPKVEGVEYRGLVFPDLHPEPEREHQLQQGWCRDGMRLDPHVFCGCVKGPLYHQELLVIRGPRQGLPDGGDILGVVHLYQV